jgi:hypothetical protein
MIVRTSPTRTFGHIMKISYESQSCKHHIGGGALCGGGEMGTHLRRVSEWFAQHSRCNGVTTGCLGDLGHAHALPYQGWNARVTVILSSFIYFFRSWASEKKGVKIAITNVVCQFIKKLVKETSKIYEKPVKVTTNYRICVCTATCFLLFLSSQWDDQDDTESQSPHCSSITDQSICNVYYTQHCPLISYH